MDINKEFDKQFSADKIWVVPSDDNTQTIKDIKQFISSKLKEVLDECIGDKLPEDIDNYAYENYVGVGYIKHRQHCIEIKNKLNI